MDWMVIRKNTLRSAVTAAGFLLGGCAEFEESGLPGSASSMARNQMMWVRRDPTTFGYSRLTSLSKLYPDLGVDGAVGPGTLKALTAFLKHRGTEGVTVMLKAMNCLQGARYIDLAEKRSANEAFLYGWLRERVA